MCDGVVGGSAEGESGWRGGGGGGGVGGGVWEDQAVSLESAVL